MRYDPYDFAIHEDPYPTYARLRAEAPLYRNEELDFWALSRHDDVLGAFRNPAQFSNRFGVSLDPAAYGPDAHRAMSFLAMDPPDHTRMRSLVSRAFTPRGVAALEGQVRAIAVEHIEAALDMGSFDFVADFAGRMPMDVISEMIGVPGADRPELRRLADLLVDRQEGLRDIPPAGIEAALAMAGYFQDMVRARRRRRSGDLTSALVDADLDGDRLSDDEVISFLFLMTVAGNETTTKLLANAWYWAWRFPEERRKVLADPARVPDWVEETLRFDTSTQMLLRVTTGEVELHGATLPDSARVLLLLGSANRDEAVFADPDRYDIGRDTRKLVSFGSGRHVCLGAALARLEARVGLHELVTRVADYEVDEGAAGRVHSINVRGFATLPTTVTTRAAGGRQEERDR
ncbi:MAG: cytochrome P450 [Acidobacteriota bacterium]|nr:cytochrome P450 [Acidobacteriota bacterium]